MIRRRGNRAGHRNIEKHRVSARDDKGAKASTVQRAITKQDGDCKETPGNTPRIAK